MKWYAVSDEYFIEEAKKYHSKKEYAMSYGLKSSTMAFRRRIKQLGITSFDKTNKFTKEELEEAISNSRSISGVIRYLSGGVYIRSYYNYVIRESEEYGLILPRHGVEEAYEPSNYVDDSQFFVEGIRRAGASIRSRLLRLGVPYQCSTSGCPLSDAPEVVYSGRTPRVLWMGKEITLQIDHIDGDNTNNLRNNLRILCPNCHAATDTYVGRNSDRSNVPPAKNHTCTECGKYRFRSSSLCQECRIKSNRKEADSKYPSVVEVITGVESKGLLQYSKDLGVSDNALRRYLRRSGISKMPRKIKR